MLAGHAGRRPGRGPAQALPGGRPGGGRRALLLGAGGRAVRPPGAQRRRQDDDHRGHHDPRPADRGAGAGGRDRRPARPGRRQAADRRRAPALQPGPHADGGREPHLPRGLLRREPARAPRAGPPHARPARARGSRERAGEPLLGRHGAAADDRPGAHARTAAPDPGRADQRPRPAVAALPVGHDAGAAAVRYHADPDDPRHERGRPPVRPDRDRRPRQGDRARHAPRAAPAAARRARARARGGRRGRSGARAGGPRRRAHDRLAPRRRRPLAGAHLRRQRRHGGGGARGGDPGRPAAGRAAPHRGHAGGRVRAPDRTGAAMTSELFAAGTPDRSTPARAFAGLCQRDLWVTVRHEPIAFLSQALLQPIFFLFVFGRVLPEIGAARGAYGTQLLPGILALTLVLTALQNTALPLVIEFSFTREIEDRLLAPLPVPAVAAEKMVIAALRGLVAAVLILPLGALILPGGIDVSGASWPEFVGVLLVGSVAGAAVGLVLGTAVPPTRINIVFA